MKKSHTTKNHLFYSLLLLLCIISSCKKSEQFAEETAVDSTSIEIDTTAAESIAVDSITVPIDTSSVMAGQELPTETANNNTPNRGPSSVIETDSVKIVLGNKEIDSTEIDSKIGKVAFFCENENMEKAGIFEMKEERSYEMMAMLNPIIENDEIKTEILKVINESRVENNKAPLTKKDITTRNVILGNYLRIQIKDPYDKFIINLVSSDSNTYTKKIYDDVAKKYINENFEWRWNVTPKPNTKGKTKLSLVISPLNKNKEIIKEKIKTYDININFKQSFFASLWDKMNRNIEWAIASIIAPILAFLVARFTKKKE